MLVCPSVRTSLTHSYTRGNGAVFCAFEFGNAYIWKNIGGLVVSKIVCPSARPSVTNAFVKWLETGNPGGNRACKGETASMVRPTNLFLTIHCIGWKQSQGKKCLLKLK